MYKKILFILILFSCIGFTLFAGAESEKSNDKLVVGFAQIGQESGWRDAETESIRSYAAENSDKIELHFADAQQKQENQIKALRSFIDIGVDVIGLPPVVETGWEAVLTEAKEAGIPVIFIDRKAAVSDDLYATFIGSDFVLEGENAAKEMGRLLGGSGNVVELEGTVGASVSNDRKNGFHRELSASFPGITVLESQTGDFTRAKGKEVMESFIKTYGDAIDGVYAHNDDMVLGAVEALKEAGYRPAVDVKTVSIDGVRDIFVAMEKGEANVTVECNPLLGPQFFEAAAELKAGKTLPRWVKSIEGVYRMETAAQDLPTRKY